MLLIFSNDYMFPVQELGVCLKDLANSFCPRYLARSSGCISPKETHRQRIVVQDLNPRPLAYDNAQQAVKLSSLEHITYVLH
jgi:hypothetical protein